MAGDPRGHSDNSQKNPEPSLHRGCTPFKLHAPHAHGIMTVIKFVITTLETVINISDPVLPHKESDKCRPEKRDTNSRLD